MVVFDVKTVYLSRRSKPAIRWVGPLCVGLCEVGPLFSLMFRSLFEYMCFVFDIDRREEWCFSGDTASAVPIERFWPGAACGGRDNPTSCWKVLSSPIINVVFVVRSSACIRFGRAF